MVCLELEFDFVQSICQSEVKNDGPGQLVSKSLRFANIWAPHGATFLFSFDVWDLRLVNKIPLPAVRLWPLLHSRLLRCFPDPFFFPFFIFFPLFHMNQSLILFSISFTELVASLSRFISLEFGTSPHLSLSTFTHCQSWTQPASPPPALLSHPQLRCLLVNCLTHYAVVRCSLLCCDNS